MLVKGGDKMAEHEMTSRQLMRKYDKTIGTIYNWIAAGLPHVKRRHGLRDIYFFNAEEVEEWLNKDKKEA